MDSKDAYLQNEYGNWKYLEEPKVLFSGKMNFDQQYFSYEGHIAQCTKELIFCAYIQTGGNNKDGTFRVTFENCGGLPFKHYLYGHSYSQSAWSYNSEQFRAPVSLAKGMTIKISNGPSGNNNLSIYLIA